MTAQQIREQRAKLNEIAREHWLTQLKDAVALGYLSAREARAKAIKEVSKSLRQI